MGVGKVALNVTLRLAALCFCFRDGSNEIKDPENSLTPYQLKHRIINCPSLIDVFSYTFTICGCFAGPFFEFKDYQDFINLEGRYKNIPSTIIPAFKKFIVAWCKIIFILKLSF